MKDNKISIGNISSGAVVLIFSTILVKIIGALFKIPLSSDICLGDLGFGYFSSAYDLFTPIYILAISGFPVAVSRLVAEARASNDRNLPSKVFLNSRRIFIFLGSLGAVAVLFLSFLIIRTTSAVKESILAYFCLVPITLAVCILSAYRGLYEGYGNMKIPALSNIIEALGKLILGFSLAFLSVKLTQNYAVSAAAAMIGIALSEMASLLYLHIKYKSDVKKGIFKTIEYKKDKELTKALFFISIPIVLASLSGGAVSLIDAFTVRPQLFSNISDHSEELMSLYRELGVNDINLLPTILYGIKSKAFTIYNLIPTISAMVGVSAVPVLAEAYFGNNKTELKKGIKTTLKLSGFISFPAGLGLFFVGTRIMELLFGDAASSVLSGKMLSLFGIAAVFSGLAIPLSNLLQSIGKQKAVLINVSIGIAVKVIFNIALSSFWQINIFGCVLSTILCYLVIFVLNIISLVKIIRFKEIVSAFLKAFVSAWICIIAAVILLGFSDSKLVTLIAIAVAGVVYFISIILMGIFTQEELEALIKSEKLLKILKKCKFWAKC